MTRTTVYLPDELKRALERAAAVEGLSEAEIIRSAIAARVSNVLPPLEFGFLDSGDGTLSQRVDELLVGFGER